ncbi:dihydrolipoyl dehydrogenase [Francisella adeliensis]|uniref:Dihydrolipoyl dehydrogenase n=1 Tax=Francisella adeliensis TaxID=2007306 RepID=A0A2Z4XY61_9GAMM|nr:dihydrolipoyl dehydrogenase [Francisella adeliensis]AXA33355.1 dihydrolipoyl dehydrogenase [Francisella adeliensis]MBK2085367.1 dihydrolipoyl dehydrogenase [Francisella adeliensis]MBK2097097.1 dihydrolipoyl dehydrogenase [Francisella adeliensis]QIW11582.1 dihydrolipoyl dehydrogenase [Francisella adeliensis]QIW13458.1 dihydrolipoyl dehydrogenase [Francisella adeliensis]
MSDIKTQLVVLGSGPGGYGAAFRAADLGLKVTLVEKYSEIGGVCLNVGCIPSKAMLHIAKVINEARHLESLGIVKVGDMGINKDKIVDYKNGVISKLTTGLKGMAKARKVDIVQGYGKFTSDKEIAVETAEGTKTISFDNCIIAVGSSVINLPFVPEDDRIIDSTGALQMKEIPETMLVVGGGIIGLEMAQVYSELGTKITVVEFADQLMNGVDKDIVKAYQKMNARYEVRLKTGVTAMEAKKDGIYVTMEGDHAAKNERYDRVLMAIGRKPNGKLIDAEKAGVKVDERGFIPADKQLRTNVPHIFAIGDVIGQPMLAHKAVPEGRTAAEVISGLNHSFDPLVIPSVAYTDPEVAWVGETETSAKAKGIKYEKGVFPWAASGRSLSIDRTEGMTKVLYDENHKIIGTSIVGTNAGELIAESTLAIEMGCDAEDIALTVHPHPTLSESLMMATEVFEGTATDLPPQRKKK